MAKPGKVSGFKTAEALFYDLRGDELFKVGLPEQHAPAELDMGEIPGFQVPIEGLSGDVQKVENLGDRQKFNIHQDLSLAEAFAGFKKFLIKSGHYSTLWYTLELLGRDMEDIYTVKETCQILKVNGSQVLRWIYSGQLKTFKLSGGRFWRIRERDLKRSIGGKSDAPIHSLNGIAPAESKSY